MFKSKTINASQTRSGFRKKSFSGIGFLAAILGAAIGLGNIWKFPYLVAQYSGAFFIPFIIGLFVIGIPILILEINLGKRMQSSSAKIFRKLNPRTEFFGWMQTLIAAAVGIYYAVIIGWSLIAFIESFIPNYFVNHQNPIVDFNNISHLSSLNIIWLASLIGAWVLIIIIVIAGIKKGIEKTNLILLPLLFIMLIGVTIYACTLGGAAKGLDYLFRIDGSKLLNIGIWKAAFGQVFFSLCIGGGVIITYAKHSKITQDTNNIALTMAFGNTLVAVISSILVFAILGFNFHNQTSISTFSEWFSKNSAQFSGPALIFQVFPSIFAELMRSIGYLGNVISILFFLTIIFAAITSIISMGMTVVDNIVEKFPKLKEKYIMGAYSLIALLIGIVLVTNTGPGIIGSMDFWVSQNFLVISGIIECILMTYFFKKLKFLKEFGNKRSLFKVGFTWEVCVGIIAPISLTVVWVWSLFTDTFKSSSFNYTPGFTWLIVGCCIAAAIISVLIGYILLYKFDLKQKHIYKFLFYILFPVIILIAMIVLSFNVWISYGNFSSFDQYFGFFIPVIFIIGGSYILSNTKNKQNNEIKESKRSLV